MPDRKTLICSITALVKTKFYKTGNPRDTTCMSVVKIFYRLVLEQISFCPLGYLVFVQTLIENDQIIFFWAVESVYYIFQQVFHTRLFFSDIFVLQYLTQ